MEVPIAQYLLDEARSETMRQLTVQYLAAHLKTFLHKQERVLLCFTDYSSCSLGGMLTDAVRSAEGIPVAVGEDRRWKSILRLAFLARTTTMIASDHVVLGLTKVAKATATPLYIRNVVLCGQSAQAWVYEGIRRGLDCRIWLCYAPGGSSIVAGFGGQGGITIREDVYGISVLDANGSAVPEGSCGMIFLHSRSMPQERLLTGQEGILRGDQLLEAAPGIRDEKGLWMLDRQLLSWSSILDYRVETTIFGVDMEIIKFPGESIPKLPSCAKLTLRDWNSERDAPFRL